MKYLSDVTGQAYDSVEDLEAAEQLVKDEQEKLRADIENMSKKKKDAAKAIQKAEDHLDEAYKKLEMAEAQARELQREYNKKLEEILHPAEEEVKKAQAERYDAIEEFNRKYGAFTTKLTGAKAADEMNRAMRAFNAIFNHFFF